ncbi:AI-2E family transporter [Butyrivibrio sp. CB08]|uniref:AI-2E family transporter n=1 Tax=Butyrivibrio sp. CB08 TaxID=2364879 RepID=UPI000EA95C14|nr:AI-2E family transporter [Butyrivibrio sp. CB08]RKM57528.1 AI-2E family transporter [Butyrivibrio sp. CB08]
MKMKPEKNQITWGVTLFLVVVASLLVYYFLFHGNIIVDFFEKIIDSVSGIILGVIIAYILIPLQDTIEEKFLKPIYKKRGYDISFAENANWKKRRQMRAFAVLFTMLIFIFILYLLFSSIIPQLISSIREIINNLPIYIKNVDDYSNLLLENNPDLNAFIDSQLTQYYATLSSFITQNIKPYIPEVGTIVKYASKSVFSVIGVIFDFVVGFIVAIYVLNSKERFTTRGKKMAYAFFKEDFANELVGGFRFVHNTFEGFIGGKLIDSIIIGVICYFGCLILGINYPVLISVIVGVTNIIPFFGPYIGGIAGALLLVLIEPIQALIFLIFVILLQQFDGNILGPRILGGSTGLSSFWVIFSITFFGGLWGIVGWLIGVPVFAVFYALVSRVTNHYLRQKELSEFTGDYYDLAYIEDKEYKLLSDKSNTKFNAVKKASTFKRIFSGNNKLDAKKK